MRSRKCTWPKWLASDLVQAWSKTADTKVQGVFSELCGNRRNFLVLKSQKKIRIQLRFCNLMELQLPTLWIFFRFTFQSFGHFECHILSPFMDLISWIFVLRARWCNFQQNLLKSILKLRTARQGCQIRQYFLTSFGKDLLKKLQLHHIKFNLTWHLKALEPELNRLEKALEDESQRNETALNQAGLQHWIHWHKDPTQSNHSLIRLSSWGKRHDVFFYAWFESICWRSERRAEGGRRHKAKPTDIINGSWLSWIMLCRAAQFESKNYADMFLN